MLSFFSSNLGVRRLGIVLSIAGAITGIYLTASKPWLDLAHRRWHHQYLVFQASEEEKNVKKEPASSRPVVTLDPSEVEILTPVEAYLTTHPWESDDPPRPSEYFRFLGFLFLGGFSGALIPMLLVHALAWVIAGFRQGSVPR